MEAIAVSEKFAIHCPCGANLRVPMTSLGKTIQCPKCRQSLAVQAPSSTISPSTANRASLAGGDRLVQGFQSSNTRGANSNQVPQADDPFLSNLPPMDTKSPAVWGNQGSSDYWAPPPAAVGNSVSGYGSAAQQNYGTQGAGSLAWANAQSEENSPSQKESPFSSRLTWFLILLMVGGPIATVFGLTQQSNMKQLASEGVEVTGQVIEGVEKSGRRGRRSYSLDVSFRTDKGFPVTKSFSVSKTIFSRHCNSEFITNPNIPIRYASSNPENCVIVGNEGDPIVLTVLGGLAFLAGSVGFAVTMLLHYR